MCFLLTITICIRVDSSVYKLVVLYFPIIIGANFASETPNSTADVTVIIKDENTLINS